MHTVKIFDLLLGFTKALGFVRPITASHNLRVAYFAHVLASDCNFSKSERVNLLVASILHDVGAIPLKIETQNFIFDRDKQNYCRAGWVFCKSAKLNDSICRMVLLRNTPWKDIQIKNNISLGANCIYLSDALENLSKTNKVFISEKNLHTLLDPNKYAPQLILSLKNFLNSFVFSEFNNQLIKDCLKDYYKKTILTEKQLITLCDMFSQVIDSKSQFTATHSHGVSQVSVEILKLTGLADKNDLIKMRIAGLLHDIGKLAVPSKILEKSTLLTDSERVEIERHPEVGADLLGDIPQFSCISDWVRSHHERLDGNGYPNKYSSKKLNLPVRVLSVADVFTALAEHRPYRPAMDIATVLNTLTKMAKEFYLDKSIVSLVVEHAQYLNSIRLNAQREAASNFIAMRRLCANF